MSASSDTSAAAQESSLPTTWQESASELSTFLADEAAQSGSGKAATVKIEKACAEILERDGQSSSSSTGDDDGAHVLPDNVKSTITTIYLRALIKLGKYNAVVDYCKLNPSENNVEEHAYCLYRTRNYDACRKLCADNGDENRGLSHIYAQALFRLGETNEADAVYRQLLEADDPALMDADEREDLLSNALANRTANYTPGSLLGATTLGEGKSKTWLEEDGTLQQLLTSYGSNDSDEEMMQNYDLAYNLATFLLVSSDARDQSHISKATHLLKHAEASALTILESSSSPEDDDEEDEVAKAAKEKKRQQQQHLAEREAGPIRANLALARLLAGGESNETEALRGYLTLVTKAAMAAKKSKGAAGALEANLMAAASNNLALLRDGKESVFDVIKRVPTTSALSVSEDHIGSSKQGGGGKGGKDKSGSATGATGVTLVGATPQQVRIALFNRALLFAKMGNATGCREALEVLRASLLVSYHGDESEKKNSTGGGLASPKRPKGKGKKKGSGSGGGGDGTTNIDNIPTAKPASEAEVLAWNARADLLESELCRISESKDSSKEGKKSYEDILNSAIAKLDKASGDDDGVVPFTKSQLLLHKAVANNPKGKAQPLIEALESLPAYVKSCPGAIASLASLHASLNNKGDEMDKLLDSLGDSIAAKLAVAEFNIGRGKYDEAVELLEPIVEEGDDDNVSMEATALLVKALSYTDPSRAEEYVERLQEAMNDEEGGGSQQLDGEALESMDVPRFAKKALGSGGDGASGSSSRVRKAIAATGGKGRNLGERSKKKNRESILRKRAKEREVYLAKLESEGRYDPNKTPLPKPDPERWIPKNQRSYNRRGRGRGKHNKSNIGGAQGGGAGAGMEKDAARLDVAARVAAAKAGGADGSGNKPSTANIKVVSSGAARKGKGGRRR